MKNLLLAATLALAAGSTPAHAVLQIAVRAGAATFTCADNAACDTNPAVGILQVGDQIIGGVLVHGSIEASSKNPNFLNTSSLSIINLSGGAVATAFAVSDTGYIPPNTAVEFSGAGTWQDAIGSNTLMKWFVDPADAQGASTPTDTPGTLIGSFSNAPLLAADAFSTDGSFPIDLNAPFSMTEATSGVLSKGAQLINRGQTEIGSIPEPSTWAMLIVGFVSLAWVGLRRGRQSRPAELV